MNQLQGKIRNLYFFSLLRASDLGTQKASPLGLSCHFVLLTSMKLTSLVFPFFF